MLSLPCPFIMRCTTLLLVFSLFFGAASAQNNFVVEQSAPAPGTADRSLTDTVAFSFSREVDVSTDWDSRFVEMPGGALSINGVSLCLNFQGECGGGNDVPRHVRFRVTHQPDTDYTWLVYAVQSAAGPSMAAPYALRYTTASTIGQGAVTGSVDAPVPSQTTLASKTASDVRPALRTLAEGLRHRDRGRPMFDSRDPHPDSVGPDEGPSSSARVRTLGPKDAGQGPFTQILLLDEFSVDETDWTVQGADVLFGSSGAYAVESVRPGAYVPVAVRYTDGTNTTIDALGFHDPDEDGTPDAVDVDGGKLTGIDLQLFAFPRTTARAESTLPVAQDSAAHYASDQELRWLQAEAGLRPNGAAHAWTYRFYSPSKDLKTEVTVTPLDVTVDTTSGPGLLAAMSPIPSGFIDSDEALQIALGAGGQAFANSYAPDNLTTLLSGGHLFWTNPPMPGEEFWHARLIGRTSSTTETFERHIDLETGDVLPVELTRLAASTTDDAVHLHWHTASETHNAGFEVQHAPGDSTVAANWETLGFVEGAGTTQRPQTYRFRATDLRPGAHRFRLEQQDLDGTKTRSRVLTATLGRDSPLRLTRPAPNPARQSATLRFGARDASSVTLTVYDVLGRKVATLYDGPPPKGRLEAVRLDAGRWPSGTYFVRLATPHRTATRTLTVAR